METNKILAKPERLMKKTKKELVDIIVANDQYAKERETAIEAYRREVEKLKEVVNECNGQLDNLQESIVKQNNELNKYIQTNYQYKRALNVSKIIIGILTISTIIALLF